MTVEILVSAYIITLTALASLNLAQRSSYISRHTFLTAQAVFFGEEGAEAIRVIRDNDWSNIQNATTGAIYYFYFNGSTWLLSSDPANEQIGGVKRKVIFQTVRRDDSTHDIVDSGGSVDNGTRRVNVNVNWTENGQYYDKLTEFYIMDIWP